MSKIKIENSIPLPSLLSNIPPLPLGEMKIGDSFLVKVDSKSDQSTIRQRTHRYRVKHPSVRFSVWKEDDKHVRVFRIADADNQ